MSWMLIPSRIKFLMLRHEWSWDHVHLKRICVWKKHVMHFVLCWKFKLLNEFKLCGCDLMPKSKFGVMTSQASLTFCHSIPKVGNPKVLNAPSSTPTHTHQNRAWNDIKGLVGGIRWGISAVCLQWHERRAITSEHDVNNHMPIFTWHLC